MTQGARRVNEEGPVRIPKDVLEELEAVRHFTRSEVLDIPTLRYVAMEKDKPALVVWIDGVRAGVRPGPARRLPGRGVSVPHSSLGAGACAACGGDSPVGDGWVEMS
jgi:hypothetical protein